MSLWSERPYEMDRYYILLQEAEKVRLVRQVKTRRQRTLKVWYRVMGWLGSCLHAWGTRLQERYETAVAEYQSIKRQSGVETTSKVAFR